MFQGGREIAEGGGRDEGKVGVGDDGGDTDLIIGSHTSVLKQKLLTFSSVKIWEN